MVRLLESPFIAQIRDSLFDLFYGFFHSCNTYILKFYAHTHTEYTFSIEIS